MRLLLRAGLAAIRITVSRGRSAERHLLAMKRCIGLAGLIALSCAPMAPAHAQRESLADAIALAYQTNPTLQSQRAQLRAIDEGFVQARAQFGPTLQAQADAQYSNDILRNGLSQGTPIPRSFTETDRLGGQISVTQPIYLGGRPTFETRAANSRIRASREALRATEGDIVYGVIQAYVDVRRDARALAIRRTNLAAIRQQDVEIHARKDAGDLTQTDVAQADAQVAAEEANVASAENQLRASRIAYASVIGRNPGELEEEPPLPNLPPSIERCWDIAAKTSPELQQALFNEEQSRARLQAAQVSDRPTLSLRGQAGYSTELDPLNRYNRNRSFAGQLVLTKPLFTSGLSRSLQRQTEETNASDRSQIEVARRSVVQSITNAWNQMLTLRRNVETQRRQVEAAALAFKGMVIEYRAGQRSTLDVLIAEETLRDAELAELAARHDSYLSSALVLRYIGRLDAGDIVAALPRYDPADHLRRVANKGALPWEPLIRLLDRAFLPEAAQHPLLAPQPAQDPMIAATAQSDVPSKSADAVSVEPVPGTTSNIPPPVRHRPK